MVRRSALDRIFQELLMVRKRLDDIEALVLSYHPQPVQIDESRLFSLPDHLRESFMKVASNGECSATEVANLTGRSRAIESSYLNQLTRMGWLIKRRDSKTLYFRPMSEDLFKEQLRH